MDMSKIEERDGTASGDPNVKDTNNLLKIAGLLLLVLAVIGAILPIMPTVPFLLGAAACFVKGSPRLYKWLISNRLFGKYLRRYRNHEGFPLLFKILSVAMILISIGVSVIWIVPSQMLWLKLVMMATALASCLYVMLLRGTNPKSD